MYAGCKCEHYSLEALFVSLAQKRTADILCKPMIYQYFLLDTLAGGRIDGLLLNTVLSNLRI